MPSDTNAVYQLEIEEMERLLAHGWQYVGENIWINPLDGLGYSRPSAVSLMDNQRLSA